MRSAVAVLVWSLVASTLAADDTLFRARVAGILEQHCLSCHGMRAPQGGFSLATAAAALAGGDSGAAIVPGKADESLLIGYISGSAPAMPRGGRPLAAAEVALIRQWIDSGAAWPEALTLRDSHRADASWWSLQPLADADPPSPAGLPDAWSKNPIDRFVFAKQVEKGLHPSPEADRHALIRRATFDLIGLPPTPEEIDAFLADASSDAYEKLIDRLLSSPHYGERWGRHWLDVIRFGESSGYERNHLRDNAWPFRDYVIRSLNDDKPFDRFVLEQLAGDKLQPRNEAEVGTGFLVAGSYDDVGNQDPVAQAQIRANTLDDTIAATGAAFLGLTVNCARCHDHKFDPILQADYYRLQATFAGIQQGARSLAGTPGIDQAWIGSFIQPSEPSYLMRGGDPQKRGETIAPASLTTLEAVVPPYALAADAPESERRMALARWIVDAKNPLTPRVLANRVWHYHFGRGIVATPSDFGFQGVPPTHPELLDWLARQVRAAGWRLKPLHRLIMTSAAYRQASLDDRALAAIDADAHFLWRYPARRLEGEAIRDAMLAVAGKLDTTMGGPGFRLYDYKVDNVAIYTPLDEVGPETYRRAVYHQTPRSVKVDLLGQFDCPDPSLPAPKREVTVSPLQALALANHDFTHDMAQALAERLAREAGADTAAQVRRAFLLCFGRAAESEETAAASALVAERGLPVFCRAMFNANEFVYVH